MTDRQIVPGDLVEILDSFIAMQYRIEGKVGLVISTELEVTRRGRVSAVSVLVDGERHFLWEDEVRRVDAG